MTGIVQMERGDHMTKREFLDTVFALAPNEANAIMDAFDEYVDSNEPHWIPVTERLPEEYCECLVTYRTVDMQEFMEILEYEPSYEFDHEKGRFKGEWLFPTDDERFTGAEVIAWQPLPEPYKEDVQ